MQSSNRHVLDATARIDSPKIRKAQLKCQPVSNAIPLASAFFALDFFEVRRIAGSRPLRAPPEINAIDADMMRARRTGPRNDEHWTLRTSDNLAFGFLPAPGALVPDPEQIGELVVQEPRDLIMPGAPNNAASHSSPGVFRHTSMTTSAPISKTPFWSTA
jgi:hypothetical protein